MRFLPGSQGGWPAIGWRWMWSSLVVGGLALSGTPGRAAPPCVHFDVSDVVACRPIINDQAAAAPTDEEIFVEATLDVSTLVRIGHEGQLLQLLFVFENPARTMRVVDYSPKTELASDVAGEMEYHRDSEQSHNANFNASFNAGPLLNGTATASTQGKTHESWQYKQLPPLQLLAASGTIARGSAVYFKLKPSPRTSLEGNREFHVVFQVPANWRGDYLRLRCAAYEQGIGGTRGEPICGSSDFFVPVYRAGDDMAKRTARRLALSERQLRAIARDGAALQHRDEEWTDKVAQWFKGSSKQQSDRSRQWVQEVLTSPAGQQEFGFATSLTPEAQRAVADFVAARHAIYAWDREIK